ncbi:hypothetical protein [Simiduia agarivorans]|uniref:Uncharacterized protein n=1 Tax=Simiduia agarivorans (strain DSM 21679 / JCM 13881 / BCRC 17597 / SA1) TaxID=1117647 RepID=K4KKI7_SIMAS|nr:hypothetical protein [Simiduia agarivorans]AFU98725.1 hypothetical protein M5M_07670 [Simiduia agarivorans SA1 = DSM 21679]
MNKLIITLILLAFQLQAMASIYGPEIPIVVGAKLDSNSVDFSFYSRNGESYALEEKYGKEMKEATTEIINRFGLQGNYIPEQEPINKPTIVFFLSIESQRIPCTEKHQNFIIIEAKLMRRVNFIANGIIHEIEVTVFEEQGKRLLPSDKADFYPHLIRELETQANTILRIIQASNK